MVGRPIEPLADAATRIQGWRNRLLPREISVLQWRDGAGEADEGQDLLNSSILRGGFRV